MTHPTAYPLHWPHGWPRTPAGRRMGARFFTTTARGSGTFQRSLTVAEARERLGVELDRLRAANQVLSTNMELTLSGQPRSGQAEPTDPGAAVYFTLGRRPMALACDRWTRTADNIAALAKHIEALRGMDRWGVGSIEQAFTGYAALAAPAPADDWRMVLGHPITLAEAEASYRAKMKLAHPDVAGGSAEEAAALNAAMAEARRHLR